jgi:phage terminase small subunit
MGDRGPKPPSKIKTLPGAEKQWPSPPVGMTRPARTVWKRTVKAYKFDFFKPQHFDLLRMYCESVALNKIAIHEGMKVNFTDHNPKSLVNKESHWVGIADKMRSASQSLATKLGLNKNSTIAGRSKDGAGENEKPKSKRDGLLGGQK